MLKVNSLSGGKTSAYLAAHYPSDYNVFALVRIEDQKCKFPDEVLRKRVEDKIQKPFIGTAEDDTIIYTMFDLEQFLGQEIDWVSGITFDEVVRSKGGWLPNKLHRYCTTHLKVEPIFYWWANTIGKPVEMQIGFRANEQNRALSMLEKCNQNGLSEMKASFSKWESGRHMGNKKWEMVEWRKPSFPLIENGVFKDQISKFWQGKPVRFAHMNNCVGCFHRSPMLLNKRYQSHSNKIEWFARQEGGKNGHWRSDTTYQKIMNFRPQFEIPLDGFAPCDSGYCGL